MTAQPEFLSEIDGAADLVGWFGYWPSFHDAEVVKIELVREGISSIHIHAFEMPNVVDERGFYVHHKHVLATFLLEDVSHVELNGFNHQNVLSCLIFNESSDGYELVLGGCYGVEGRVVAKRVRIVLEPGVPAKRVYAKVPV